MALQLGALRDALIEAGASEVRAQRAAEELAGYEREFAGIRGDMQQGFAKVDQQFAKVDQQFTKVDQQFAVVRGDINLLRWMAGANFALTLAVFVKLFIH
jgi:chitinase